jgi:xylulokinase
MTEWAADSSPGANGVIFLPHMMGERAPIWDPHARGVFFGLSLSTTRGDMARAVMEGAAFAMRHVLELIQEHGQTSVRRVVTVGGASRNPLWRQIKADVWGIDLAVSPVSEATALGAALTAGVGAGVYSDLAEAVARAVPQPHDITRPDPARGALYEHPYRVYRRLYPALAETMTFAATAADPLSDAGPQDTDNAGAL